LFLGPRETRAIRGHLVFGDNEYRFDLKPTVSNEMVVEEWVGYRYHWDVLSTGRKEPLLKQCKDDPGRRGTSVGVPFYVYESVSSWIVYHFHDTSSSAPMRRDHPAQDWGSLREDASNIAPFLLKLHQNYRATYDLVRDTTRLVAPFFDDFRFEIRQMGNERNLRLEWTQKGSDFPFQPWHLSDGTIRFICLATALLQPSPPATMVIDEPELGLHPHALEILAGLIRKASERTQVILSTQSVPLLNQFEPEDVIVVTRQAAASHFERLDPSTLAGWLEEYSLGELWQKNFVEAGATYE
jgi:predicted ATPase